MFIYMLAHGQTPIKGNWVLPHPHPCQKPSIVDSYTSASLSQLRVLLFDGFLSRLLFYLLGGKKTSLPLFLICESAITNATIKVGPWPFTDSRSMNNGIAHWFWWQYLPKHPHGLQHPHGLWWQFRPWISTCPSATEQAINNIIPLTTTQAKNMDMASRATWAKDINMVLH